MKIIKVCMLLHNFIIDNQKDHKRNDTSYVENFNIEMDHIQPALTAKTNELPLPLVSDNNEPSIGRRPSADAQKSREIGDEIRYKLALNLSVSGLKRPIQNGMKYNQYGHVYMTG